MCRLPVVVVFHVMLVLQVQHGENHDDVHEAVHL